MLSPWPCMRPSTLWPPPSTLGESLSKPVGIISFVAEDKSRLFLLNLGVAPFYAAVI